MFKLVRLIVKGVFHYNQDVFPRLFNYIAQVAFHSQQAPIHLVELVLHLYEAALCGKQRYLLVSLSQLKLWVRQSEHSLELFIGKASSDELHDFYEPVEEGLVDFLRLDSIVSHECLDFFLHYSCSFYNLKPSSAPIWELPSTLPLAQTFLILLSRSQSINNGVLGFWGFGEIGRAHV